MNKKIIDFCVENKNKQLINDLVTTLSKYERWNTLKRCKTGDIIIYGIILEILLVTLIFRLSILFTSGITIL